MQVLTFANVPNGGQATLPHDIRWNARPVIPDWIVPQHGNGAFTVVSCTTTDLTIQNDSGALASFTFFLVSWWSPLRQFNDANTQFLSPLPFVTGEGSSGPFNNGQAFRYTVTGLEPDLTDFFVPLPVARANDNYRVQGTPAGMTNLVDFDLPDLVVGVDRTTTQFRLVSGAPLQTGDQIDFFVCDPVP